MVLENQFYYTWLAMVFAWVLFKFSEGKKVKGISSYKLYTLIIIGCLIAVIPNLFDIPLKFNVIGYIPYAFGLFVLTLKDSSKSVCHPMEYLGEFLSLYVYIFHTLIGDALNVVLGKLKFNTNGIAYLWFKPIVVVLLSIFVSWMMYSAVKAINKIKDYNLESK